MARDQVEEVKQKTDIVSIIGEHVELKKAGTNFKALCPFHGEKSPSFMVSPELQRYKCFGCGESGDVFNFLEKHDGMEFYEALKFLADRAGIKLKTTSGGKRGIKQKIYEINALAARFYQYILLSHPVGKEALNYLLKNRGLKLATIKQFQLGFSPDAQFALKKLLIDKKRYRLDDLVQSGLAIARGSGAIDRFRGRIIFPLHDHRGNPVGFAGRIMPRSSAKSSGWQSAKYINSPETPAYHKSSLLYGLNVVKRDIKLKNNSVIVEGELDMISSWQTGVKTAIAIKGSALTEEQVRLLSRFTTKAVLALDSDFAGDRAARRGVTIAQELGLQVRVARIKGYSDPDEMARKNPKEYKKVLTAAVNVWEFIIDQVFAGKKSLSGEAKARVSKEIVPVLASIPDKIVQAHYTKVVAARLDVPVEAVSAQVGKLDVKDRAKSQKEEGSKQVQSSSKKTRRELLEERFLSLGFQSQSPILTKPQNTRLVRGGVTKRIIKQLRAFHKKKRKFNISDFAASLPGELVSRFSEIVLKDVTAVVESPALLEREMELIIGELGILNIKDNMREVAKEIAEFESAKKKTKLKQAEKKFDKLSKKLLSFKERHDRGIIL